MVWKKEMKQMKLESIKEKAPAFFELSGGYDMITKPYNDKTANGLTKCILDFIIFKGGTANRINSQGQPRVEKIQLASGSHMEKVRYTPSMTNRGTADIHACIQGRHVSIEVKIGADKMSLHQHKEKERIEKAGGLYWVAKDMVGFIKQYTETFEIYH